MIVAHAHTYAERRVEAALVARLGPELVRPPVAEINADCRRVRPGRFACTLELDYTDGAIGARRYIVRRRATGRLVVAGRRYSYRLAR